MPIGLQLSPLSGSIAGIPKAPTASGGSIHTVTARNSKGTDSATIRIVVLPEAPRIALDSSDIELFRHIDARPFSPSNTGGAATSFEISPALPSGLSLSTVSGRISGIPTVAAKRTRYVLKATNPGGSSTAAFYLSVATSTDGVNGVAIGRDHICVQRGLDIRCTGDATLGQKGERGYSFGFEPTPFLVLGNSWHDMISSLVAGSDHTCFVSGGWEPYCFGLNQQGQLGMPTGYNCLMGGILGAHCMDIPLLVEGPRAKRALLSLTAGTRHVCASNGEDVECWGDNTYGQLGFRGGDCPSGGRCQQTPRKVTTLPSVPSGEPHFLVTAGANHTCAWRYDTSDIYCWGSNAFGELGSAAIDCEDPQLACNSTPQPVTYFQGSGARITSMHLGHGYTCVVASGYPLCWGDNAQGQLGIGSAGSQISSRQFPAPPRYGETELPIPGSARLAVGHTHACALFYGEVWCWGDATSGTLGNGSSTGVSHRAVQVLSQTPGSPGGAKALRGVLAIYAGENATCASLYNGELRCWGSNSHQKLGLSHLSPPPSILSVASEWIRGL